MVVFSDLLFHPKALQALHYCFFGRQKSKPELKGAERIVVIRLDNIGDLVCTTGFLRELRRAYPSSSITLLIPSQFINLFELCPYVDNVLGLNANLRTRILPLKHLRAVSFAIKKLRRYRFDLAILPRRDVDWYDCGMLAYFSGARCRVGHSERVKEDRSSFHDRADLFLTHALTNPALKHEVEHNMDLIHFISGSRCNSSLEVWTDESDRRFAQSLTSKLSSKTLAAIGIGASARNRIWPTQFYCELAKCMQDSYGASVIILGGPGDSASAQEIIHAVGGDCVSVAGQATLRQSAAILRQCSIYIGNDSGPAHIAAAVGTPVIVISCHAISGLPHHASSPIRVHPWGVDHTVVQPGKVRADCRYYCRCRDAKCISSVSVQEVKAAITSLLLLPSYVGEVPVAV